MQKVKSAWKSPKTLQYATWPINLGPFTSYLMGLRPSVMSSHSTHYTLKAMLEECQAAPLGFEPRHETKTFRIPSTGSSNTWLSKTKLSRQCNDLLQTRIS